MQELEGIVSRAALQSPEAAEQLPEEVFWFATQSKDRLKWNLLSPGAFPWLKKFLRRSAVADTLPLQLLLFPFVPHIQWHAAAALSEPVYAHAQSLANKLFATHMFWTRSVSCMDTNLSCS